MINSDLVSMMVFGAVTVSACVVTAATNAVIPPKKENFHLFLLVGQSNMAGRGHVEEEDKVPPPRVLTLDRDGKWVPAVDPIHFDKAGAGVGPGRTFGMVMAEHDTNVTIGLIPCAAGGSPISTWEPGQAWEQTHSHPYDDALKRAKLAMESGVLKGILWHQGEGDSSPVASAVYETKLHALIQRLRTDLKAPEVPFIAGQLGRFAGAPWNESKEKVNHVHETLPQKVPNTAFVSSEGLTDRGDHLHFDAKSQRTFGKRYAEAYLKLTAGKGGVP